MRISISKKKRFTVLARDGFKCVYCKRVAPPGGLHVDHVLPVSLGGSNDEENLVTSCLDCNVGKGTRVFALKGITFLVWLRHQAGREDPVGDLADDEARDRRGVLTEPKSLEDLVDQLECKGACSEALDAARDAWQEYQQGGQPTEATLAVQQIMREEVRSNATDHACLWLKDGWMAEGVFYPYSSTSKRKKPQGITL